MIVDLAFSIVCPHAVPADHGYLLYAAISRALPEVHQADGFGIHPIAGRQLGGRTLQLTERSRLVIRTDAELIARFLPLAGKQLQLLDRTLRIGIPQVRAIVPATVLRSRLVTIKNGDEPEHFLGELRRKLDAFGVSSDAVISIPQREGRPLRRTLKIKDKEIYGYEVILEKLAAAESLVVQENSPANPTLRFARTHMGCGIFTQIAAPGDVKPC